MTTAETNLLFGLFALRFEFISREGLIGGLEAWSRDREQLLADLLLDGGAITAERRVLLDGLLAEHRKVTGESPLESIAELFSASGLEGLESDLNTLDDEELSQSFGAILSGSSRRTAQDLDSSRGPRMKILRQLGVGGFGVVSRATDLDLEREVAVKQLKPGKREAAEHVEQFIEEAQIGGSLQHPGIVPIYGLGLDDDGHPYYVMRLIEGQTLNEEIAAYHAADASSPSTLRLRSLLRRLIDVCNAIQYAHKRKVLHRDLKPGNVMLGEFGETLVLDWGLAGREKAEDTTHQDQLDETQASTINFPDESEERGYTENGQCIGTLAYMSPEQAAGDLARIGKASDIYGLGAILYQVLTGRPPHQRGRRSLTEALQVIRAGDLTPPRGVRSDVDKTLEAVCLKALASEPDDRYTEPADLAADLERWLADEPVSAITERRVDKLRRWMRHNTRLITNLVVGAVVLLIAAGIFLTVLVDRNQALTVARRDAERARDTAQAINAFWNRHVIRPASPFNGGDRNMTLLMAMQRAAERIDEAFEGRPLIKAEVHRTLGKTLSELGDYKGAEPQLRTALALLREHGTPGDTATLRVLEDLGFAMLRGRSNLTEALAILEECREGRLALFGPNNRETLVISNAIVLGLVELREFDRAEALARETSEKLVSLYGRADKNARDALGNYALVYAMQNRFKEAAERFRALADAFEEGSPKRLSVLNNLAASLEAINELDEAEEIHRQVLSQRRELLPENHPDTLNSMQNLALVLEKKGPDTLADAEALMRDCLQRRRDTLGEAHRSTLDSMQDLANLLQTSQRVDEATDVYRELLAAHRSAEPVDTLRLAEVLHNFGVLQARQGASADARPLLTEELRLIRSLAPNAEEAALAESWLARVEYDSNQYAAGLKHTSQALAILEARAPKAVAAHRARALAGACHSGLGQFAEAEPLLITAGNAVLAMEIPSVEFEDRHSRTEILELIIEHFDRRQDAEQAGQWRQRLERLAESESAAPPKEN